MPFLPYKVKQWYRNNEQIFYIIFLVIAITRMTRLIILKPMQWISEGIIAITKMIFGI